jgi:hypothetical protein
MGERPAPPHPERILMELFGNTLGLQRILAQKQGLENAKSCLHELAVREHASIAGNSCIGMNRDESVD